ncbi:MAG: PKD domain-containing protein [Spirochaetaceae bacterium]
MKRLPLLCCLLVVILLVSCESSGGGAGGDGGDGDSETTGDPAPPNAAFDILTSAGDIRVGTPVEFDASASDDGDGLGEIVYYLWDFDYDEEGGFRVGLRTDEPITSRIFHYPRAFTVGLIVIDNDDLQSEPAFGELTVADAEGAVIIVQ